MRWFLFSCWLVLLAPVGFAPRAAANEEHVAIAESQFRPIGRLKVESDGTVVLVLSESERVRLQNFSVKADPSISEKQPRWSLCIAHPSAERSTTQHPNPLFYYHSIEELQETRVYDLGLYGSPDNQNPTAARLFFLHSGDREVFAIALDPNTGQGVVKMKIPFASHGSLKMSQPLSGYAVLPTHKNSFGQVTGSALVLHSPVRNTFYFQHYQVRNVMNLLEIAQQEDYPTRKFIWAPSETRLANLTDSRTRIRRTFSKSSDQREETFSLVWTDENETSRTVPIFSIREGKSGNNLDSNASGRTTKTIESEVTWDAGYPAISRLLATNQTTKGAPYTFSALGEYLPAWIQKGFIPQTPFSEKLINKNGGKSKHSTFRLDFDNGGTFQIDRPHLKPDLVLYLIPEDILEHRPTFQTEFVAELLAPSNSTRSELPTEFVPVYVRIDDIGAFYFPDIDMLLSSKLGTLIENHNSPAHEPLKALHLVIELVPHSSRYIISDEHIDNLTNQLHEWKNALKTRHLSLDLRVSIVTDTNTLPIRHTRLEDISQRNRATPAPGYMGADVVLEQGGPPLPKVVSERLRMNLVAVNPWLLLDRHSQVQYLTERVNKALDLKIDQSTIFSVLSRAKQLLARSAQDIESGPTIEEALIEAVRYGLRNSGGLENRELFLTETVRILAASHGGFSEPIFRIEDLRRIESLEKRLDADSTTASQNAFIGRKNQILEIKQNLLAAARGGFKDKPTNLILLFGESGTGKTELAEQVALEIGAERRYVDMRNYDPNTKFSVTKVAASLHASNNPQKILTLDELDKSDHGQIRGLLGAVFGNQDGRDEQSSNLKGTTVILILNVDVRNSSYQSLLSAYRAGKPIRPYFVDVIRNALIHGNEASAQKEFREVDSLVKRMSTSAIFLPPISSDTEQQQKVITKTIRDYEAEKGIRLVIPQATQSFMIERAVENSDGNFRTVERTIPLFIRAAEAHYVLKNPEDQKLKAATHFVLSTVTTENESGLSLSPLQLDDRAGVTAMVRDYSERFYDRLARHFREKEELLLNARPFAATKADSDLLEFIAASYRGMSEEIKNLRASISGEILVPSKRKINTASNAAYSHLVDEGRGNQLFSIFPKILSGAIGVDSTARGSSDLEQFAGEIDKGVLTLRMFLERDPTQSLSHANDSLASSFESYLISENIGHSLPYSEKLARAYVRALGRTLVTEKERIISELVDQGTALRRARNETLPQLHTPTNAPELARCLDLLGTRRQHSEEIERQFNELSERPTSSKKR